MTIDELLILVSLIPIVFKVTLFLGKVKPPLQLISFHTVGDRKIVSVFSTQKMLIAGFWNDINRMPLIGAPKQKLVQEGSLY